MATAVACSSTVNRDTVSAPTPTLPTPSATARPSGGVDDAGEWSMFRLNLEHTGTRGTDVPPGIPRVLWEFNTGGIVESSPTVAGGAVYEGTFNNALFALDAATGELRWRFPVGGLLRASPSVVDDTVYFGADDNLFYAVNAITGEKRWSFALGPGGEQSSPAVADGKVYFGAFDRNV